MHFLGSGVFWTIIGIIVTIIIAIITLLCTVPRKTLRYSFSPVPLIEAKTVELQNHTIVVDGQSAESVTKTRVCFINTGNRKIKSSDFSKTMPLMITVAGKFFCPDGGYTADAEDPKSIKLDIDAEKGVMKVSCKYIKPKQPFSIDILHDGKLSVSGVLTSGKIVADSYSPSGAILMAFVTLLSFLGSIFFCALIVLSPESSIDIATLKVFAAYTCALVLTMPFSIIYFVAELQALGIIAVKKPQKKNT